MKFSLIIPLWNEGDNVSELIRVIAKENLFSNGMAELILVNNGSTDNTGELVNQLAKNIPGLFLSILKRMKTMEAAFMRDADWLNMIFVAISPEIFR